MWFNYVRVIPPQDFIFHLLIYRPVVSQGNEHDHAEFFNITSKQAYIMSTEFLKVNHTLLGL